ncbi:epoxide hydrolase [Ktedonosporobacter rubrisoli]|uniref:Epoxide hydrolase n=1 Tax=Ktedonosporobacter rubrisoli TaxID=2509675 RepID=A0A4P6JHV2_KTERU|nr:epoxide hydrolase family protein [Ktedonosporobacter rubrisoli]QBD74617.1 epoxide hydrolase [Ktedonosporobacter rubrisoli]
MSIQPFTIAIPPEILSDLQSRLGQTRWPDQLEGAGWDYGTNLEYLRELVDYWQHKYDWRVQEAWLNQFANFRANIDGLGIHFIHEKGKGPDSLPIIITHGWPSTFFEMLKLVPLLTDPARYGGDPADAFDVVVPSLPGFGFSDRPASRGWQLSHTAELWARLMADELGYKQFAAAGGDFGSGVTRLLALAHPNLLIGIHLTYLGFPTLHADRSNLTAAEQQYLQAVQQWMMREGGYAMIHSTKPQTLAYGLNDSPVGLAGWIVEKFQSLSDCDGELERSFSKDELLNNIMIYWVTETLNSSIRTYYENVHLPPPLQAGERIKVPAGVALFPKEANRPPREWGERSLQIERWTEMPRGGHFAALEEPELLAEEMRTFFRPLRNR